MKDRILSTRCSSRCFHDVFNAEDVLRAKRFMKRMPCTEVKPGDIVVGEALLVRWQGADKDKQESTMAEQGKEIQHSETNANKPNRFRRHTWENWRVELRLEALWYIYAGSDYYSASAGPGEEVEI